MSVDISALSDRLYADALAAILRSPAGFCRARTIIAWDDVEAHVRERAAMYKEDLSAAPSEVERALEDTHARWRELASDDHSVREISLLVRFAKKLLLADGPEMVLRVDRAEPGREILQWRFVSLAMP